MNTKPFHFKLKKVEPKEQRALEALFEFLPRTGMRDKFQQAITNSLSKHLNIKTKHHLETISQEKFDSFVNRLPDPALLVVLGMPPRSGKIILDVDTNLAAFFVERLLGSDTQTFPLPKSLSDIEQGVLQYLALQVLSHIYRLCGKDSRVQFRFEKFLFNPKELHNITPAEETVFILTIKITIAKNDGFIRLALPSPLVEELYLNVEAKGETREAERNYLLGKLQDFDHIKTPLWGEAGSIALSAGDIKNLEVGDVIIFDKTELTLEQKKLSGKVILRAGHGQHGGFVSEITTDPKHTRCKITDLYKGEDIL